MRNSFTGNFEFQERKKSQLINKYGSWVRGLL